MIPIPSSGAKAGPRTRKNCALRSSISSTLLDQAAAGQDLQRDEERREFLGRMLAVAARIPDAAARDQFADRLAHKARITEEVVRAEIKKAAAKRETAVAVLDRPKVGLDQVKTAEKGLIWALLHDPAAGAAAVAELERDDLVGLATETILEQARALAGMAGGGFTAYPSRASK